MCVYNNYLRETPIEAQMPVHKITNNCMNT